MLEAIRRLQDYLKTGNTKIRSNVEVELETEGLLEGYPKFQEFYSALESGVLDKCVDLDFKDLVLDDPGNRFHLEGLLGLDGYRRFKLAGKLDY